jgi:thiol-disulfide isomerase/thioredoxin
MGQVPEQFGKRSYILYKGMDKMRFLKGWVLIIALVLISGCSKVNGQAMGSAPDFSLELLNGEKIVLSEVLKKKKALLLFWTTWCPHCRREMVKADEFYKENKDTVAVIGINVGEGKKKVEGFIRNLGVSYPVALDPDNTVSGLYKVRGVPTVIAVDKKAKITYSGHRLEEAKR